MITTYTSIGRVEDAKLLFDEMLDRDVVSWNLIITSYAKMCGKIKDTHGLFGKMLEPDAVLSVIPLDYAVFVNKLSESNPFTLCMLSGNTPSFCNP